MSFHAKALEVYTLAHQSIQSVDEEEDLEVGSAKAQPWPRHLPALLSLCIGNLKVKLLTWQNH